MARFPDLPMPERPRGTPEQEIAKMHSYLWQLAEALNNALSLIDKAMAAMETGGKSNGGENAG
jgi:hypothetical protein